MKIITWKTTINGERSVYGYAIVSNEKAEELKSELEDWDALIVLSVDGYEEIYYDNGNQLLDELDFTSIDDKEVNVFKKFIGMSFGNTEFLNSSEFLNEEQYED